MLYNAIHDVTQPPVLFHRPTDHRVQAISMLFSDAQTHYSDYIGNLILEVNACSGGSGRTYQVFFLFYM